MTWLRSVTTRSIVTGSIFVFLLVAFLGYRLIFVVGADWAGIGAAIFSSTLAVIVALAPVTYSAYQQRKREFEAAQREKKIEAYENFADYFYDDLLQPILDSLETNTSSDSAPVELKRKMTAFTKAVTLWGGDDVIKAFVDLRRQVLVDKRHAVNETTSEDFGEATMIAIADLFLAIRRDLGYQNDRISRTDLFTFFGIDPSTLPQSLRDARRENRLSR